MNGEKEKAERIDGSEEKKPWWVEWIELIVKLTGAQDLLKKTTELEKIRDKNALTDALKKISVESRSTQDSFIENLRLLLQGNEADKGQKIEKLVEDETKNSGLGKLLKKAVQEPNERDETLKKGRETVEKKIKESQTKLEPILERADANNNEIQEIQEMLKAEAEKERPLTPEQQVDLIDKLFEELRVKNQVEKGVKKGRGIKPKTANEALNDVATEVREKRIQEIWEKVKKQKDRKVLVLTDEENKVVLTYFIQLMDEGKMSEAFALRDRLNEATGNHKFDEIMASEYDQEKNEKVRATRDDLLEMAKNESELEQARLGGMIDVLNRKFSDVDIENTLGSNPRALRDREAFERMPNDALLNIDRRVYADVNEKLKKQLNGQNAIVEVTDRKIPQVNKALNEDQRKIVNEYFANRLNGEVRMLTDESVGLNEARSDNRGTEYTTLMSVMGLDTSMKSVIMSEARFITMSYLLFNKFQNSELQTKLLELGADLGPEFNIYVQSVMRKNDFKIEFNVEKNKKMEQKEIMIGPLSRMDFVTAAQQQITSREDMIAYEIDPDADPPVIRTFAEMMFISPKAEERAKAKEPLTRKVIIEQHGEDHYKKLLREAGAINKKGEIDKTIESKFLQKIGNQYWDYYNGIYVYMSMNQSFGESVINCNPQNGAIMLPQGMGEMIVKMNPEAWAVSFEGSYDVHKLGIFMQVVRHMGVTSMGSKEGKEVFSYLLNETKDIAGRISIEQMLYGKGIKLDPKNSKSHEKMLDMVGEFRSVVINALYEADEYHMGAYIKDHNKKHDLEHLADRTHIYDGLEAKMKNGQKDFDPTLHRRDLTATRKRMTEGIKNLHAKNPEAFNNMNFEFFKERFGHDKILMNALNNASLSNLDKMLVFANRFGDDKMLFDQLSVKRPDDPMKYANEYYPKFVQAINTLTDYPSFKNAIEALRVVESIVGKGKIGPIAKWLYKMVVELREERMVGEKVALIDEPDGVLMYKQGNYVGDIPGRKVVPDLREDEITWQEKIDGKGKTSIASAKYGILDAVDDEHGLRAGREAFKAAMMFTNEYFKKLVEEERVDKRRVRNPHKPFIGDMWNFVTGKKLIEYLSVEVFNIPAEMFSELVVGGTIELAEVWLGYFNGGKGHH